MTGIGMTKERDMRLGAKTFLSTAALVAGGVQMLGQQPQPAGQQPVDSVQQAMVSPVADPAPAQPQADKTPSRTGAPPKHKVGPFDISINWRTRVEGWNWFEGNAGNSDYPLEHTLLRVGIGQSYEKFDWFVEGALAAVVGLPDDAVAPPPLGQLGHGASYYAANGNNTNNVNAFLKQAFVNFKHLGPAGVKLGRFEFFDGMEVKPDDPLLATVIQTRIAHRLISNFGFSAVQRTFDGGQFSLNSGNNNFTFFAARPTEGVFQVDGMNELDIETYYGAYNRSVKTTHGAGDLRLFALGYIDGRTNVLKADNRPAPAIPADHQEVEIATWGADYAHVFNTTNAGKFDFLVWGAVQTGSWGTLTQQAGAFVGEAGWQPAVKLKPWLSAGYSYGSGDGHPKDSYHGTFFQVLTTPRQYARFPFYNMMNNADVYATLNLRPAAKLALRSELHALRLANSADLWYSGGGAFQSRTFGYSGRPSHGHDGLANVWDLSADYQVTRSFSATLYYGHAWGKAVISSIYPKDSNGQLAYLETNFHF
jgi:hypothetical protein